ncbi:ClpXP adapter SpxH family protein [Bacillaceae bacterium W0354]
MRNKTSPAWHNLTSSVQLKSDFNNLINKPVEIYVFIDPLCPNSWSLEPYFKKLIVEYGCYFKLRPVTSGNLYSINKKLPSKTKKVKNIWEKTSLSNNKFPQEDVWVEDIVSSPWDATLAIKAAELQGQRKGAKFVRKLQEYLFLGKQNISDIDILIKIAKEVKMDVDEFLRDIDSNVAKRALQGDLNLAYEMEINNTPAVVFFNKEDEDDGLKVSGIHDYDVYVKALYEVMNRKVSLCLKPSLEEFLSHFTFVSTKDVAVVYDWSLNKAEKELKKLLLSQKVRTVPVEQGSFWEYTD